MAQFCYIVRTTKELAGAFVAEVWVNIISYHIRYDRIHLFPVNTIFSEFIHNRPEFTETSLIHLYSRKLTLEHD